MGADVQYRECLGADVQYRECLEDEARCEECLKVRDYFFERKPLCIIEQQRNQQNAMRFEGNAKAKSFCYAMQRYSSFGHKANARHLRATQTISLLGGETGHSKVY